MMDTWPASMRRTTAAAYLDVSIEMFSKIVAAGHIPSIQHWQRGDRYYLREDLDAYLEARRRERVTA